MIQLAIRNVAEWVENTETVASASMDETLCRIIATIVMNSFKKKIKPSLILPISFVFMLLVCLTIYFLHKRDDKLIIEDNSKLGAVFENIDLDPIRIIDESNGQRLALPSNPDALEHIIDINQEDADIAKDIASLEISLLLRYGESRIDQDRALKIVDKIRKYINSGARFSDSIVVLSDEKIEIDIEEHKVILTIYPNN